MGQAPHLGENVGRGLARSGARVGRPVAIVDPEAGRYAAAGERHAGAVWALATAADTSPDAARFYEAPAGDRHASRPDMIVVADSETRIGHGSRRNGPQGARHATLSAREKAAKVSARRSTRHPWFKCT